MNIECVFPRRSRLSVPCPFIGTSVGAASVQVQLVNLPSELAEALLPTKSHCEIVADALGLSTSSSSASAEVLSLRVSGRRTFTTARKVTLSCPSSVPDTVTVPA